MLDELRKELWETMYLNPVWPDELLETAKEPGYQSIEFKSVNKGLEVELTFIDEGVLVTAIYNFDKDDLLQEAHLIENGTRSIIYHRNDLISEIMAKITLIKKRDKLISA